MLLDTVKLGNSEFGYNENWVIMEVIPRVTGISL